MTGAGSGGPVWWMRVTLSVAFFAIALGIAGRFAHLDFKIFWPDETYSMLRITGHTEEDLGALIDRRPHPVADLAALARLDPARGYGATMAAMREEPQRGPLFYIVARFWAGIAGDGVARMRALAAFFGTAGIAFAFLLGRRLTGGVTGGLMLAALVAVSPIMLHLSRQVREYIVLADATLASGWLLLRYLDRPVTARLVAYAAASVAGFFISPIFMSVWLAQAITVTASRRERRAVIRWWIAIALSAAVCLPWLRESLLAAPAHARDLTWLADPYGAKALALKWVFNVGAVFFDSEIVHHAFAIVLIPVFAIVAVAFAAAVRRFRDPSALLALTTVACGFAPSVAIDAVKRTHFEAVTRYQMVAWVGIEMVVVLALASGLASAAPRRRSLGGAAFAVLVAAGLFSYAFDRPYALWWDNNDHLDYRNVARAIASQGPRALVISSNGPVMLAVARYLPPDTRIVLFAKRDDPPRTPADALLFEPTARQLAAYRSRLGSRGTLVDIVPPATLAIPALGAPPEGGPSDATAEANPLWRLQLPVP